MKFSVVYLSYRPGGIDILADSLAHQTCQDYELICVDDLVSRKQLVWDYLVKAGVKVSAISPSKRRCFPELAYGMMNVLNTGILLSKGDYILVLQDYCWVPPDGLEKFLRHEDKLKQNCCISGVAVMLDNVYPKHLDRPISIWDKEWSGDPFKQGYSIHSLWFPKVYEGFYAIYPYKLLWEMNGFPECYDCTLNAFEGMMGKIALAGGSFFVDGRNVCYMLNHKEWGGELWNANLRQPNGSREFIPRENTFNLRTHKRGTIDSSEEGGDMVTQQTPVTVTIPWKQWWH